MLEILIAALLSFAPKYLDQDQAELHASAALAAEDAVEARAVTAELLLSIAWVESRFNQDSLSYRDCSGKECKRKTGKWDGEEPPPGARPSWYCGTMQVGGWVPWEECQRLRSDLPANYLSAAEHLEWWLNEPNCLKLRGDPDARLDCALRGYSGGYAAIKSEAEEYVGLVHAAERRFSVALEKRVASAR